MREIKFRVWDGKKMHRSPQINVLTECNEYNNIVYVHEKWEPLNFSLQKFQEQKNAVLMQYTGLTDKNGKEIYEGDYVKSQIDSDSYQIFEVTDWFYLERRKEIGEDLPRTRYCEFTLTPKFKDITGTIKNLEVIGNIYENPELIK